MSTPTVCIFDYGFGNVRSATRALEHVGAEVHLTADRDVAMNADGLVVPGVGAFAAVMNGLQEARGDQIVGRRLSGGRPVLGICVGMQVMFSRGVEHGQETEGLDQWPGTVELLQAPVVPNMGWATIEAPEDTVLFDGVQDERFYFVHSYGAREFPLGTTEDTGRFKAPSVTWSEAGTAEQTDRFVAAVENGPLAATQFHPEKSGEAGLALLRNWVRSL
ncbi:imidazole glycerol phosphate synthase subunit HisH [Demequina zhanjiangensis]|uniref:Imidazole glycerol phosphate synthase subunit HisH n=1 Tax=Demequina zhanjiangensis TaxID=3051659 RepID=A0ABT8G3U1_9MICO|nr:imidazole glycerol phosphate synthase subunit HisH [Demequina sp. SYSU T00b26]MDN4473692.1 imidazole glycerol phosphate synthase subunit HisH [Demequina sp. SYSU T00b26]